MAENPITGKGIFTHLATNFPSVQSAAVTHVEANGGDDFYMVLVRAQDPPGQKQQATGDNNGSKRTKPGKKHKPAKDDEDGTGRLHTVLNRHLMKLLQEPLSWEVFGEKDKQQATGDQSGRRHAGGRDNTEAPEEDSVPTSDPQAASFPGQAIDSTQQAADSVDAVFQTLSDLEP